ncbi:uncharacterized protein LOC116255633 [Nymphaea colorata]|nr:uncharacterized protein LOC116255633 [Nymphaea colorata]
MAKKKSDSGFGDRTEGAHNCQRECVQPSFSSGGSSRNCYEELRDIIRKSLVRQNLLPLPSETGRASPDCLSLSTSDSVPAKKKVRMPNVIARLMGLEELPLEDQGTENKGKEDKDSGKCEMEKPMKPRRKHEQKKTEMPPKLGRKIPVASVRIDGRRGSNGPKPSCDMDMPMRRLSHHLLEEMVPRRRRLKEIIESMQLTGLLNRGGNHGESFRRPRFATFDQKQNEKMKVGGGKFVGEVPPIVIIKPMVVTKVNREREKIIQEQQPILEKKPKAESRKARTSDRQGVNVKTSVKPEMKQLHDLATRDEKDKTVPKKPLSVVNHDRKPVPDSRPADAVKAAMPRKPLDKLHPEKEQLRRCHSSRRNHISNGLPGREPMKSCDQKNERTEKAKPAVQLQHVNKMAGSKCKKDETIVNLRVEKRCVSTTASSPHQLGAQEAKDCSRKRNPRGIDESKPVALSEQTSKRNHRGRRYRATKETSQQSGHEILCPEVTVAGSINKLKQFLLNSTSFLSAAQEYFDIEVTMFSSPANYKEFVGSNDKLLMDCVFELMKYKSQKHMPRYTITKLHLQKQRARFLSDVLVEELCKELETLFSLQVINNVCAMDDLYLILERDLLCRRLNTSCVWDFGWECGALTEEESDVVFCQLEMLVLGELIEETVADLCAS